jgi:hypothetical protein
MIVHDSLTHPSCDEVGFHCYSFLPNSGQKVTRRSTLTVISHNSAINPKLGPSYEVLVLVALS